MGWRLGNRLQIRPRYGTKNDWTDYILNSFETKIWTETKAMWGPYQGMKQRLGYTSRNRLGFDQGLGLGILGKPTVSYLTWKDTHDTFKCYLWMLVAKCFPVQLLIPLPLFWFFQRPKHPSSPGHQVHPHKAKPLWGGHVDKIQL